MSMRVGCYEKGVRFLDRRCLAMVLKDMSPGGLQEHVQYILGKQAYSLRTAGSDIPPPSFELVLAYEL
eukprot:190865-Amphidinium_carterae.2